MASQSAKQGSQNEEEQSGARPVVGLIGRMRNWADALVHESEPRDRWLRRLVAGALVTAVAGVATAAAETFQVGNLILTVDGDYSPHQLPRHEFAPVGVHGEGHGRTDDGSLPPVVEKVIGDVDANGTLTTRGIAECDPKKLQNTTTKQALKKCGPALVGRGQAQGIIAFPDQEPFIARGPLLGFNGPPDHGRPTVIFHVLADVPLPTTFVVRAVVTDSPLPGMGKRIVVHIPPVAGYNGRLTDVWG
ncbi:MAG TPA: hypothetical protein VLX28_00350, partial [Thermoanaerobaculia bacterium]|nr:hypothetical protein [Thermoanaerobaculia bacterium]